MQLLIKFKMDVIKELYCMLYILKGMDLWPLQRSTACHGLVCIRLCIKASLLKKKAKTKMQSSHLNIVFCPPKMWLPPPCASQFSPSLLLSNLSINKLTCVHPTASGHIPCTPWSTKQLLYILCREDLFNFCGSQNSIFFLWVEFKIYIKTEKKGLSSILLVV